MEKRHIIPLTIVVSLVFNISFALFITTNEQNGIEWGISELGPAVMQDSYYGRAPGIESPFGLLGDVPGGYSIYHGSPIQTGNTDVFLEIVNESEIRIDNSQSDLSAIYAALLFAVLPIAFIWILGRRSYGSSKTQ